MSNIGTVSDSENDSKDRKIAHYYLAGIDHNYVTNKDKTYQMLCFKYALQ